MNITNCKKKNTCPNEKYQNEINIIISSFIIIKLLKIQLYIQLIMYICIFKIFIFNDSNNIYYHNYVILNIFSSCSIFIIINNKLIRYYKDIIR